MKKYVILTSLLALAACGGGSGGSGGGHGVPGIDSPVIPTDTIAASNSNVTGMVSNSEAQVVAYVVNKLGDDAESVGLGTASRGASTRAAFTPSVSSGNMNYDKAKELMELAQWLGDETTTHDDIVAMFNASKNDQNKIKSALKLLNDMYCYVGGSADETANRILERRDANAFDNQIGEIKEKSEIMVLDNAEFNAVVGTGAIATLKFNVRPDGTIDSIYYPNAKELAEKYHMDVYDGDMKRQGNTAIFVEIADDEETLQEFGHAITVEHEYISYAKELGLKYSDFGVLRTDYTKIGIPELDVWGTQDEPFAGGYAKKNINDADMKALAQNGEIKFTGLARGEVTYHDWGAGIDGADIPLPGGLTDKNATLVFAADGTQTLKASFSNWYDIAAVKNADGQNQFKIVGGADRVTDSRYQLSGETAWLTDGQFKNNADNSGNDIMVYKTGYYGDNGNPSEGVALMQYQHASGGLIDTGDGDMDYKHHLNVDLGFGGKR